MNPREISITEILNPLQEQSYASSSKSQLTREDEEDKVEYEAEAEAEAEVEVEVEAVDEDEAGGAAQTKMTPTRNHPKKRNNIKELDRLLVKQIAEHITLGTESDEEAPQSTFWRTLDPTLSQLEMADILWERSLREDDPGPVRWLNRFYAACMYRILQGRGSVSPSSEKVPAHQEKDKEISAESADVINLIANKIGVKAYAGLASMNNRLAYSSSLYILII